MNTNLNFNKKFTPPLMYSSPTPEIWSEPLLPHILDLKTGNKRFTDLHSVSLPHQTEYKLTYIGLINCLEHIYYLACTSAMMPL